MSDNKQDLVSLFRELQNSKCDDSDTDGSGYGDLDSFQYLSWGMKPSKKYGHPAVIPARRVSGKKFLDTLSTYKEMLYNEDTIYTYVFVIVTDKISDPYLLTTLNFMTLVFLLRTTVDEVNYAELWFYKVDHCICSLCRMSSFREYLEDIDDLNDFDEKYTSSSIFTLPIVTATQFEEAKLEYPSDIIEIDEKNAILNPGQHYVQCNKYITGNININNGPIYHITGDALRNYLWPITFKQQEPVQESEPVTESEPVMESKPVKESEPVTESKPVMESKTEPAIINQLHADPDPDLYNFLRMLLDCYTLYNIVWTIINYMSLE